MHSGQFQLRGFRDLCLFVVFNLQRSQWQDRQLTQRIGSLEVSVGLQAARKTVEVLGTEQRPKQHQAIWSAHPISLGMNHASIGLHSCTPGFFFPVSVLRVSWYLSVHSQDSHSSLQALILSKCFSLGMLLKFLWSSSSSVDVCSET